MTQPNDLGDSVIQQLVQWGEQQASVRAMILTSTRAIPGATFIDALSDYDVILILTDIHPFFEGRTWLEDFGHVLAMYCDPILLDGGLERSGNVVQYESGLRIDFSLWPVELLGRIVGDSQLPNEFDAGYRVLLDKDDLAKGLKPPTYRSYIPKPPTEPQYQEVIELFFLDATVTAKFLWRDDIVAAKHILDHFIKQDYLLPMLEWRSEIDHDWSVKPGPHGRRLKQWLRPDLWSELESTYAGAGLEENWDALLRTITLFQIVAIEIGNHLGYAYPQALYRRVIDYLQKVRNLDRGADSFFT